MARILLTGASGFVGHALSRTLKDGGHAVTGTDIVAADGIIQCDLTDSGAVRELIDRGKPEILVHAGGISGGMVAASERHVFAVNEGGTSNLIAAAQRHGRIRIVYLSSIAVYAPAPDRSPVRETAPLAASDAYGKSKIAAESLLRKYGSDGGDIWALRISSIYGPGRVTPYLLSDACNAAAEGKPIAVTDERSNMRQFVHVEDVANAVHAAISKPAGGFCAVNISGGSYLSEARLITIMQSVWPSIQIAVVEHKMHHHDGKIGPLDISKASDLLDYRPQVPIETGLQDLTRHLRKTSVT